MNGYVVLTGDSPHYQSQNYQIDNTANNSSNGIGALNSFLRRDQWLSVGVVNEFLIKNKCRNSFFLTHPVFVQENDKQNWNTLINSLKKHIGMWSLESNEATIRNYQQRYQQFFPFSRSKTAFVGNELIRFVKSSVL